MTGETHAVPWGRRIVTVAVLVIAGALVAGSSSPFVAAAMAAVVVLVGGLSVAAGGGIRASVAGSALVVLGMVGSGAGIVGVAVATDSTLLIVVAGAGCLVVLTGLAIDRVKLDSESVKSVVVAAGVAGIVLLLVGVIWQTVLPSSVTTELLVVLLGLHPPRPTVSGLLVLIGIALASLTLALAMLPDVTLLGPYASEDEVEAAGDLQQYLGIAAFLVGGTGIVFFMLFAAGLPLSRGSVVWGIVGVVTTNSLLRGVVLATIVLGGILAVFGVGLRTVWETDDAERRRWITMIGGGVVAAAVVLSAAVVASVGSSMGMAVPASGTTIVMSASVLAFLNALVLTCLWGFARFIGGRTVVPFVFAASALVAVVALVQAVDAVVTPLIAVGATFVAWDLSTYGSGLADELGAAAPTTEGELAHAGGSVGVASIGVAVAVVAAFTLDGLGPILASGGATMAVTIGAIAIVLGAILVAIDRDE